MVFPDLKINAVTTDGESLCLWGEHKWNSACLPEQLESYKRLAGKTGGRHILTFIGADVKQQNAARTVPACVATLWEDVYIVLNSVLPQTPLLCEFLNFMKTHGLSPAEPFTARQLQAFVESRGFLTRLIRYGERLKMEYEWETIPPRYREKPEVKDRFGRVALELATKGWAPTITLGFLHSPESHGVSFTAPETGIDLMLRIETSPTHYPNPAQALKALAEKAPALRRAGARVLLKGDLGNKNPHNLLIAQKSLAAVIEGKSTEREQLDTIYGILLDWLNSLFADGQLEPALQTITAQQA